MQGLTEKQKQKLKKQWSKEDNLEQYALVHIRDEVTDWDFYLLSLSPDEKVAWAIINGVDLTIEPFELEVISEIDNVFNEGIMVMYSFLPIQAGVLWEKLKARRQKLA